MRVEAGARRRAQGKAHGRGGGSKTSTEGVAHLARAGPGPGPSIDPGPSNGVRTQSTERSGVAGTKSITGESKSQNTGQGEGLTGNSSRILDAGRVANLARLFVNASADAGDKAAQRRELLAREQN